MRPGSSLRLFVEHIEDGQFLLALLAAVDDVGLEHERGDGRIAVEHDVEVGDPVPDHPLALFCVRPECRLVHVAVDAADHMVVARREATPLLAVGLLEDSSILVNEGLANDLDFFANERRVRGPRWRHALRAGGDCRGHDEHGADDSSHVRIIDPELQTRKRETAVHEAPGDCRRQGGRCADGGVHRSGHSLSWSQRRPKFRHLSRRSCVLIMRSRMFFVIRWMRGSSRRKSLRGGLRNPGETTGPGSTSRWPR